jgi:hypothetical protein
VFTLALTLLVVAPVYFLLTTLVDLYPLNNVRGATRSERRAEVAVNAPVMALPAILLVLAAALSLPVLAYAGGAIEFLIVAGGLLLWWLPYLTGRSVPWATAGTGVTWSERHSRTYAETVIVLPRIADRPRPQRRAHDPSCAPPLRGRLHGGRRRVDVAPDRPARRRSSAHDASPKGTCREADARDAGRVPRKGGGRPHCATARRSADPCPGQTRQRISPWSTENQPSSLAIQSRQP